MKQFFHDLGIVVATLVLALIASSFCGGPLVEFFHLFVSDDGNSQLFWHQMALSLAILLPIVILAWAFRGRLLPDSFVKCDILIITLATLLDLGTTYYLLNETGTFTFQMPQFIAATLAWLLAIVMALSTNEQGRFILVAVSKLVVFGLTAPFFMLAAVVLWPFFPRGKHYYYICRRIWAPFAMGLAGVKFKTEGLEKLDFSKSAILVPTHSSILDIVALVQNVPQDLPMLAKKTIFYVPVFGQLAALAGYVFIDRRHGKVAMDKLDLALKRVIKRGQWLAIFAEGTRSPEGQIYPLKKGAFVMAIKDGLPIVPVAIIGAGNVLPIGSFLVHPGTITLRFGDPIPTTALTMDDRQQLQEQTRAVLAELSGAVMTDAPKK